MRASTALSRAVSRFDRAVARTDPMIAPLDLEIARLDGENSLAYGAIRQDDWPDAPPYPGMRPFDACNTPFPDRTFILVSRNSGEPSWSLPRLRPGTNLNGRLKLRF